MCGIACQSVCSQLEYLQLSGNKSNSHILLALHALMALVSSLQHCLVLNCSV